MAAVSSSATIRPRSWWTARFRWAVIVVTGRSLPGSSHPAVAYYEPCPQRLSDPQLDTVAAQQAEPEAEQVKVQTKAQQARAQQARAQQARTGRLGPPLRKRCGRS